MGYNIYTNQEFKELANDGQINIMALFGNGVDIQLMEYLKSPYRTSYQNFYNYLCYKNFDKDNIIFQKMTEDKKDNENNSNIKQNWSDFENSLIEIFSENNYINEARLTNDFNHFQVEFSNFLNDIITPNMLAQIGNDSSKSELAISSFQKFLADLDESNFRKLSFPSKLYHYKLFNWEILNFNYTSMLDNILVLDKEQYDPHPWPHADRQISFAANPNNFTNDHCSWDSSTYFSSYLMTNITHPHGYQNVPKSMLFGFDNENQITNVDNRNKAKNFLKPYWAQNDKKHKSYFNNTDLFILYGLSLGDSDFWWWNNILNSLLETDSELIIYNYNSNNESDSETINRFIDVAKKVQLTAEDIEKLHKKIAVVQYDSKSKLHAFKLDRLG
ncbi:AbiH family protein [Streptococcus parasanguinis]|uniref:AbiH family protein n=1 Tax=Streptococcus parasanguinis TaxID=1318 RepID=UPI0039C03D30